MKKSTIFHRALKTAAPKSKLTIRARLDWIRTVLIQYQNDDSTEVYTEAQVDDWLNALPGMLETVPSGFWSFVETVKDAGKQRRQRSARKNAAVAGKRARSKWSGKFI